jgi:hypothetical protein
MTKIVWSLKRQAPSVVDVTSSVLSFSYMQGRENYLDQYSGGTLSVTLKNQANIAQYFTFNSEWYITSNLSSQQNFWLQDISFDDYPGNTGLSTITVSLVDVIARNGRNVVTNVSLTETYAQEQLETLWNTVPYKIGEVTQALGVSQSKAAAITYTGSMSNYLNLITATEKGLISFYDDGIVLIPRSYVQNTFSNKSFTRNSASSTAISYYAFNHNKAGLNFMNNVTVNPNGLASQTATNSDSLTAYGNAAQSVSTVDATTTQALGLAQWLSNSQADPEAETWSISFLDIIQNDDALVAVLQAFCDQVNGPNQRVWNLTYRVPGAGSDTTVKVVIEGISLNAVPEKTDFTVFFSPLTYYQFFTLDSTILGILDTSRLAWRY